MTDTTQPKGKDMRKMFKQVWSTITTLFGALERGAIAIDHLARVAEEEAASFADEAAHSRQNRLQAITIEK